VKYAIQLATKIDLRVYKFSPQDRFVLGAILSLCSEFEKKIELNIWVDKDLDVSKFTSMFISKSRNMHLIDFVYYRLDFKHSSFKLNELTKAFN